MKKREREEDFGGVVRRVVEEAGLALGLSSHLSSALSASAEERFRLNASGMDGYVAKTDRRKRNSEIRTLFNGANEEDLAKRYGLTSRRIRQILKDD